MRNIFPVFFLLLLLEAKAQPLYFPPTSGTTWDTLAPASLGWCQPRIDSLYNYLQARHTKAWIMLKDGKIVLEHYFGSFTADSIWYWASASKSLTATLAGIARQEHLLHLTDTVSNYLGNGWTACTTPQERQITIFNLLTMTSGLNDTLGAPCINEDTASSCLRYLAPAGTRWAYHTGAYRKLEDVISAASATNYNLYTASRIGTPIGMTGAWFQQEYYSTPRSMARFGLLALHRGVWANDSIVRDTAYWHAMTHTSQSFNLSYGYLWWLNGKASCMVPGLQVVFPQMLIPSAPPDLFAALGKNDQKIYVVPSRNLVVIRMGNAAYSSGLALTQFDNELWQYIDSLDCSTNGVTAVADENRTLTVFPNPACDQFVMESSVPVLSLYITDVFGRKVYFKDHFSGTTTIDCGGFPNGVYFVYAETAHQGICVRKVIIRR